MSTDSNITRRQAVKTAGLAGAAYLIVASLIAAIGEGTAIAAGGCAKLTPELTEGPCWVNAMLRRSNVVAKAHGGGEQAGVPLDLYINVVDSSNDCKPLDGVAVDIWHANAHGLYSDESSQAAGGGTSSAAGDTITDNWAARLPDHRRGLRPAP
jgi:protocatechuate 3,4-dioxygenase beta subunit